MQRDTVTALMKGSTVFINYLGTNPSSPLSVGVSDLCVSHSRSVRLLISQSPAAQRSNVRLSEHKTSRIRNSIKPSALRTYSVRLNSSTLRMSQGHYKKNSTVRRLVFASLSPVSPLRFPLTDARQCTAYRNNQRKSSSAAPAPKPKASKPKQPAAAAKDMSVDAEMADAAGLNDDDETGTSERGRSESSGA